MKIHIKYFNFRTLFNFDLKELNWSEYIETYVKVNIFKSFFYLKIQQIIVSETCLI